MSDHPDKATRLAAQLLAADAVIVDRDAALARLIEALTYERARADGWRDKFNADTDRIARLIAENERLVETLRDIASRANARVMSAVEKQPYNSN